MLVNVKVTGGLKKKVHLNNATNATFLLLLHFFSVNILYFFCYIVEELFRPVALLGG